MDQGSLPDDVKKRVIEILETIVDPEIGIDVYNLGLIYNVQILNDKNVKIEMTFTTSFCPISTILPLMIIEQLKEKLGLDVDIEIIYDPPWTPARMTEKGRELFKNRFGYDIVEMYTQYTSREKEQ
ncbi:MAG: metal-sulfur cluster assembly factor [Desulfurococcaceae archaeon]